MGKVEPRSVTPIISALRNVLLGRKHTNPLRYGEDYSPRTQPPPQIPGGPHHVLANNYYYARDARREVAPPTIILSGQKQISSGAKELASVRVKTPGKQWKWD